MKNLTLALLLILGTPCHAELFQPTGRKEARLVGSQPLLHQGELKTTSGSAKFPLGDFHSSFASKGVGRVSETKKTESEKFETLSSELESDGIVWPLLNIFAVGFLAVVLIYAGFRSPLRKKDEERYQAAKRRANTSKSDEGSDEEG